MVINIKIYPAKNGDSFLVSFGDVGKKQTHIVIDCGYTDTFENYLKNDLIKITKNGGFIEKLILTHIDADHIQGAIKLLKDNNLENFVQINEVWHNTFRHLFEVEDNQVNEKTERILKKLIQRGYPNNYNDEGQQEISAKQATTVGALILQGKYPWNICFNNHAVSIDQIYSIDINKDANIFLLSPDKQKMEGLKSLWEKELKKYDANYYYRKSDLYDDAFEMLLSWEKEKLIKRSKQISASKETLGTLLTRPFDEDDTASNGSSIAFILNIKNKKILFLADAHPDLIVRSLNKYQKEGEIIFDLIKVSHHGSFSNINQELLNKIDSKRFLISTNGGKHDHPDKETIAHIISRKSNFHRELYFNYVTNSAVFFDKEEWMKKYNYSIHYLNQPPYTLTL